MARSMSLSAVVRTAIEVGAIPGSATEYGKGGMKWESRGLIHRAFLWKDADGQLAWDMYVGDATYWPLLAEHGYETGMSVHLRHVSPSFPWPTVRSDELISYLGLGMGAAGGFVRDRLDLCELLATLGDMARGEVYAWLPLGGYPARLVESLILARDLDQEDLSRRIIDDIHQGSVEADRGRMVDVTANAKKWAKDFSAALNIKVDID